MAIAAGIPTPSATLTPTLSPFSAEMPNEVAVGDALTMATGVEVLVKDGDVLVSWTGVVEVARDLVVAERLVVEEARGICDFEFSDLDVMLKA